MQFLKVILTYHDGSVLSIKINEYDIEYFFSCIGKHEFYFDRGSKKGFWVDIDKLKYMTTEEITENDHKLEVGVPVTRVPEKMEYQPPDNDGNTGIPVKSKP